MILAKLSRIKIDQLRIIESALLRYSIDLEVLINKYYTSEDTKTQLSICKEIHQEVNKKLSKDFPAANNSIKLPYHKLKVITNAFLHYQKELKTDSYESAVLLRYINTLMPQL